MGKDLEIAECRKAIEEGHFIRSFKVRVEALPNEKGFVCLLL